MNRPALDPSDIAPVRALQGHVSAWLLGIEGVGLSGAARLLSARGLAVRGSDREPGPRAEALRALGIAVGLDTDPDAIPS